MYASPLTQVNRSEIKRYSLRENEKEKINFTSFVKFFITNFQRPLYNYKRSTAASSVQRNGSKILFYFYSLKFEGSFDVGGGIFRHSNPLKPVEVFGGNHPIEFSPQLP